VDALLRENNQTKPNPNQQNIRNQIYGVQTKFSDARNETDKCLSATQRNYHPLKLYFFNFFIYLREREHKQGGVAEAEEKQDPH